LLDAFRSSHGKCGDVNICYEMFSSMGNGFTFELESLIFYALAKATCEAEGLSVFEQTRSITVFGDDIIIPQICYSSFCSNLKLFGFEPNLEKSFSEGFFFESCGADYYRSVDVRPFFLRRITKTVKDVFFLLNSILFRQVKSEYGIGFLDSYCYIFGWIRNNQFFGPMHFLRSRLHGKLSNDDMESVLRVPLEFAQARGGVKFDTSLFSYRFKRFLAISVNDPLGESSQYAVQHAKYQTFLQGNIDGKVVVRGQMKTVRKVGYSSSWNGTIGVGSFRKISAIFQSVEEQYFLPNELPT